MTDRQRVEVDQVLLRVTALRMEVSAASLRLGAAAARAATALAGFNLALREHIAAEEAEMLFSHPDLMEVDMADAAWNPDHT